jgi:hypothetical protein
MNLIDYHPKVLVSHPEISEFQDVNRKKH